MSTKASSGSSGKGIISGETLLVHGAFYVAAAAIHMKTGFDLSAKAHGLGVGVLSAFGVEPAPGVSV